MYEEWREISDFPGYSVSNTGMVRNDDTGHVMTVLLNQFGLPHVGLTKNRKLYKRGVALLVATAFIFDRKAEFNTPINLDGNRFNNHVENLMWRPRWFAVKYFQQFQQDAPCFSRPIQEIKTEEIFDTSWHAVTKYGLLDREIAIAIMTKTYVFPTYQEFRLYK